MGDFPTRAGKSPLVGASEARENPWCRAAATCRKETLRRGSTPCSSLDPRASARWACQGAIFDRALLGRVEPCGLLPGRSFDEAISLPRQKKRETREGEDLQPQVQRSHVARRRAGRSGPAFEIVIRDTHLPAYISGGRIYVQAPLIDFLQAVGADVSQVFGAMETGVSEAGSPALSPADLRDSVSGTPVGSESLVPDSGVSG